VAVCVRAALSGRVPRRRSRVGAPIEPPVTCALQRELAKAQQCRDIASGVMLHACGRLDRNRVARTAVRLVRPVRPGIGSRRAAAPVARGARDRGLRVTARLDAAHPDVSAEVIIAVTLLAAREREGVLRKPLRVERRTEAVGPTLRMDASRRDPRPLLGAGEKDQQERPCPSHTGWTNSKPRSVVSTRPRGRIRLGRGSRCGVRRLPAAAEDAPRRRFSAVTFEPSSDNSVQFRDQLCGLELAWHRGWNHPSRRCAAGRSRSLHPMRSGAAYAPRDGSGPASLGITS
jgi:hypothetical protein